MANDLIVAKDDPVGQRQVIVSRFEIVGIFCYGSHRIIKLETAKHPGGLNLSSLDAVKCQFHLRGMKRALRTPVLPLSVSGPGWSAYLPILSGRGLGTSLLRSLF